MMDIIQIHDQDNVVVALKDLSKGQTFTDRWGNDHAKGRC